MFELIITHNSAGVPVGESVLCRPSAGHPDMATAPFGTLISQFLAAPLSRSRGDPYWAVLSVLSGGLDLEAEQVRVREAITKWLAAEAGGPDRPSVRFFLECWSQEERDHIQGKLRWVWLRADADVRPADMDFDERFKRLVQRAQKARRKARGPGEGLQQISRLVARMNVLQWGYGSEDVSALVWLEVLLCVQHDLWWQTCGLCGQGFVTRDRKHRTCPICRSQKDYAARYQRERRKGLEEYVRKKLRSTNADRMRLLRGSLTPEEFIRRNPGYRPRKGSQLYAILYPVARDMVKSGVLSERDFLRMFPGGG